MQQQILSYVPTTFADINTFIPVVPELTGNNQRAVMTVWINIIQLPDNFLITIMTLMTP